jgi:predicted amidohydrolase
VKTDRRKFIQVALAASAASTGATLIASDQTSTSTPSGAHQAEAATSAGDAAPAMIKPYLAMVVQSKVIAAKGMAEVHQNLEHVLKLIDQYMKGVRQLSGGGTPKLVVFPEAFLHGFGPMATRTYQTNSQFALRMPGPETAALGEKCKQYGFYLAGAAFEKVEEFPRHFFNTGFIISPQGEIILKYRKINASNNNLEISSSPVDVLKNYGPHELFPVAKTPIGNLGMFICYDGWFPEVARCLMINGAEVMLRPMGAAGVPTLSEREWWVWHNRSRAHENLAYVLGANWADSPDSEYGSSSSGNSMIVDFRGNVVAQHTDASEWFVMGAIDVEALRKARSQIFMNYIAQLRMEVYANVFQGKSFFPPNAFLEKNKQSQDETWAIQTATVERLRREGILEKPFSM